MHGDEKNSSRLIWLYGAFSRSMKESFYRGDAKSPAREQEGTRDIRALTVGRRSYWNLGICGQLIQSHLGTFCGNAAFEGITFAQLLTNHREQYSKWKTFDKEKAPSPISQVLALYSKKTKKAQILGFFLFSAKGPYPSGSKKLGQ